MMQKNKQSVKDFLSDISPKKIIDNNRSAKKHVSFVFATSTTQGGTAYIYQLFNSSNINFSRRYIVDTFDNTIGENKATLPASLNSPFKSRNNKLILFKHVAY